MREQESKKMLLNISFCKHLTACNEIKDQNKAGKKKKEQSTAAITQY